MTNKGDVMKQILILISILLISTDLAYAQCGVRRQQVETRQKSSVTVPEGTTEVKNLATVSKKEAKKIATSQYNGKVKKAELVTEEGTLVWKLEVKGKDGGPIKELLIDPANGTFLGYGLTK